MGGLNTSICLHKSKSRLNLVEIHQNLVQKITNIVRGWLYVCFSRARRLWGIPTYIGHWGPVSCWVVAVSHVINWMFLLFLTDTGQTCHRCFHRQHYTVSMLASLLLVLGQ